MAADESLKFNFFEIKSNLTGERVDLRSGIARVEYRESVFSPYLEVTGYLADTGNTIADKDDPTEGVGLLDGEMAQGTEEMLFEIEDAKGYKVSLAQDANLRLATVSATKQSFQAQTYVITAVSKEAFDNTLVRKRCTMQYSGKISDVVDTIFKKDLESSSTIDIDPTINEYHEWGNKRYPFDMILDLQKLGIPDSLQTSEGKSALGKTAGYLFWQTSTSFHFKSIDKLFDMTDKKIKVFVENKKAALDELPVVSSVNGEGGLTQADGKILYSFGTRNVDALGEFESAGRGSVLEVYNPNLPPEEQYTFTPLGIEVDGEGKSKGNGVTAGRNLPVFNPEFKDELFGIERTRAAFAPVKGQEKVEEQVKKTAELNYDVETILQQSHQSYRQKMNVFMEIIISADLSLHAGDLVYCEFEEMTTKKTQTGSKRRDSGIYMIADLCHYGDGTKAFTGLNLVRDAYGVKSPSS
tara:strand:- start:298 stop:1701 length:1404 start_codon:yes stop_codon:yes gene_type:complete